MISRLLLQTAAEAITFCVGLAVDDFGFRSEDRPVGWLRAHIEDHPDLVVLVAAPTATEHHHVVPQADMEIGLSVGQSRSPVGTKVEAQLMLAVPLLRREDVAAGTLEGLSGRLVVWNPGDGVVLASKEYSNDFDGGFLEAFQAALDGANIPYTFGDLAV